MLREEHQRASGGERGLEQRQRSKISAHNERAEAATQAAAAASRLDGWRWLTAGPLAPSPIVLIVLRIHHVVDIVVLCDRGQAVGRKARRVGAGQQARRNEAMMRPHSRLHILPSPTLSPPSQAGSCRCFAALLPSPHESPPPSAAATDQRGMCSWAQSAGDHQGQAATACTQIAGRGRSRAAHTDREAPPDATAPHHLPITSRSPRHTTTSARRPPPHPPRPRTWLPAGGMRMLSFISLTPGGRSRMYQGWSWISGMVMRLEGSAGAGAGAGEGAEGAVMCRMGCSAGARARRETHAHAPGLPSPNHP